MMYLKIKQIAEARGLKRTDLSRDAKLTFNTVDRLWVDPDVDIDAKMSTLQRIAEALGVTVDDLIASSKNVRNDAQTSGGNDAS